MTEPQSRSDRPAEGMVPGELNQAFVRLVLVGGLTLYTGITTLTEPGQHSRLWFAAPVVYLAWSALLLAWAYWFCRADSPHWSRVAQRVVCMISDYGALSFGVSLGGAAGAPLYPIYLWITFGNGIRYGLRYLTLSTLIGILSFLWMLLVTPYWHENLATGLGLLLGLAVLPAYVAQLLKRLTRTLEAVQEANEVKSRFIANMSHELRTPLHGVIAVADLMEQYDLRRELKDMLRMIQSSARTQLGLVNRILDVSRLAAGQLTLAREPFRLVEVLRESDDIIRPQARAKGLEVQLYVDARLAPAYVGSPEHLRQVLVNLLGNAVKFTERGRVALGVGRVRSEGGRQRLRFEVSDTGIGIAREAQGRIFKPFAQADNSVTRRYGGTGLGVSISQELVRLMGGQITVQSEPGRGSTFAFEIDLPLHEPGAAEEDLTEVTVWTLGFSEQRTVVRSLLGYRGVRVLAVPSLQGLVEGAPLGVYRPAVALLVDAAGTQVDPVAAARELRADPNLERLPLIAVDCGPGRRDLIEAGYTALLPDLLDPTPLFRAVATARALYAEPSAAAAMGPAAQPLRVLVADDNATNRAVLRMVLEQAGHTVTLVEDGTAALEALNEGGHDLALLDMHMPGMSGTEAARRHGLLGAERTTPIVLVTADTTDAAREEALRAGVQAILIKPIRPAELRAAIERALPAGPQEGKVAGIGSARAPALRGVPAPALLEESVLEELLAVASGPGVVEQLVSGFLADGKRTLQGMERALNEHRYQEFYDLAHGLKGSAHNVGAVALAQRLGALERLEIWQLGADGAQLLELAAGEFARTEAALAESLARRERAGG